MSFAADLNELDRVTTIALPGSIECLARIRNTLHQSIPAQDAAFGGHFWLGMGDLWENYRRFLEEAIERYESGLDLSRIALTRIAADYRYADETAAHDLHSWR